MLMGYPITLHLRDKAVLVVGGGPVATHRVCRLLADGARVTVVAPRLSSALGELAAAGRLRWLPRHYRTGMLTRPERVWLVHTATGVPDVDETVASDAERLGIWCVRADDGARSAAWSPAVAEGAPGTPAEGLTVAVTGDRDPRRARAVRDAILAALDSGTLPVRRQRPSPTTTAAGPGWRPPASWATDPRGVGALVGGVGGAG